MNIKTFTAALSLLVAFMATIVRDCGAKRIWCNFLTVFVVPAFILELTSLFLSLKNRNQIVLHFLCSVLSGLNGVLIVNRWDVKSLRKIQDLKLLSALTAMILMARLSIVSESISAWIQNPKMKKNEKRACSEGKISKLEEELKPQDASESLKKNQ